MYFKILLFIYIFLAVLVLHSCVRAFIAESRGYSLGAALRLLIAIASLVAENGL